MNDLVEVFKKLILSSEADASDVLQEFKKLLSTINKQTFSLSKNKVKSVKKVRTANDEYVYDIGMKNEKHPWFFGNNMLLHNSIYFSAYPILKDEIEKGEIEWTKESVIELYDNLVPMVNDSFAPHLLEKFNVPIKNSNGVIKGGREIVAESAIFIVKKRYAALVYDKDGIRQDINGKPGKVKAMGLDLKRADTPKIVQKFLSDILLDTLTDKGEEYVINKIRLFKEQFENLKPWEQGTPRAVNKLTYYKDKEEIYIAKKCAGESPSTVMVPGHVRGSLNWNRLREIYKDHHSPQIVDGQKIIVCKLKQTADNFYDSISYPVDITHLPEWFTNLPFDTESMITAIVDQKVRNLLSVMNWDLSKTNKQSVHFDSLFG